MGRAQGGEGGCFRSLRALYLTPSLGLVLPHLPEITVGKIWECSGTESMLPFVKVLMAKPVKASEIFLKIPHLQSVDLGGQDYADEGVSQVLKKNRRAEGLHFFPCVNYFDRPQGFVCVAEMAEKNLPGAHDVTIVEYSALWMESAVSVGVIREYLLTMFALQQWWVFETMLAVKWVGKGVQRRPEIHSSPDRKARAATAWWVCAMMRMNPSGLRLYPKILTTFAAGVSKVTALCFFCVIM